MTNLKSIRSVAEAYAKMVTQEGAPADAKAGPEDMDPATKKMKGVETKVEDAPYTNKADGSENVVPADKPAANPSEMPTLKKETTQKESTTMTDPKSVRSVAEAYAEMVNEAGESKNAVYAQKHDYDTEKSKAERASEAAHKATAHAAPGKDYGPGGKELHAKAAEHHANAAKLHTSLAAHAFRDVDNVGDEESINRAKYHAAKAGIHHARAEHHHNMTDWVLESVGVPKSKSGKPSRHALSAKAWAASEKADETNSAADHDAAFEAHVEAMKAHDAHNPNSRLVRAHMDQAEYHNGEGE